MDTLRFTTRRRYIAIAIFIITSLMLMTLRSLLASPLGHAEYDESQKRRLSSFKWLDDNITSENVEYCRNTVQGKTYITDDQGYTCERRDVNQNGCCKLFKTVIIDDVNITKASSEKEGQEGGEIAVDKPKLDFEEEDDSTPRFSCSACNLEYKCCSDYEFCVSCCLGSNNRRSLEALLVSDYYSVLENVEDQFDLCVAVCRTSSKILKHEREYKSNFKYCFSSQTPPL
eukprot:TRINITY_DN5368_c0_g1_i1.p1 TRINITY_DN5368_c0_g1~~TRINITY_DN5368_c0_g1_i1.p1  ORF type:complete len:229 (+),score=29.53 TRINITY_DN5368_c0_g1_i1:199-885(+)